MSLTCPRCSSWKYTEAIDGQPDVLFCVRCNLAFAIEDPDPDAERLPERKDLDG